MKLTLTSNPPATLPTVNKLIDVGDPNDQLEIAKQAALFAPSPEGWNLKSFGGFVYSPAPGEGTADFYSIRLPLGGAHLLGYDVDQEAKTYDSKPFHLFVIANQFGNGLG